MASMTWARLTACMSCTRWGDTFALERDLDERQPKSAIIIGAGYVGLEMAEAFIARGIQVTQLQRGPEVISTTPNSVASSAMNSSATEST
ncbi:MAG: CoA-disulfide reductase [Rhodoglobus sp.]|nr:CoA-disulfide reductase [Rhodoglobus sp.]